MSASRAAKQKSAWSKFESHPFVRSVDADFKDFGFELSDYPHYVTWVRSVFEKTRLFICLLPNRSPKQVLDFNVQIGVESSYVTEVENSMRTWECSLGMSASENFPYSAPIRVVSISLHWLLLNANPPETKRLTWSGTVETAKVAADQLRDDIVLYGFRFFQQADEPKKLIHLLQNIDAYPKKFKEPGPSSPDAGSFAALLLHQTGFTEKALQELEVGRREMLAKITRLWADSPEMRERNLRSWSCRVDRFRQYLLQSSQ